MCLYKLLHAIHTNSFLWFSISWGYQGILMNMHRKTPVFSSLLMCNRFYKTKQRWYLEIHILFQIRVVVINHALSDSLKHCLIYEGWQLALKYAIHISCDFDVLCLICLNDSSIIVHHAMRVYLLLKALVENYFIAVENLLFIHNHHSF